MMHQSPHYYRRNRVQSLGACGGLVVAALTATLPPRPAAADPWEAIGGDALVVLPLDDEFPKVRPTVPRIDFPATQPSPLPPPAPAAQPDEAGRHPTDHFYAGAGVFDGALQQGTRAGELGLATMFGAPADLYLIAEAGATWDLSGDLPGRLRVGGWHATGTFEAVGSGPDVDGAAGWYVVLDQKLWRENPAAAETDDQGIGLFVLYDQTADPVFAADRHVAAGVAWKGMTPPATPTRSAPTRPGPSSSTAPPGRKWRSKRFTRSS